MDDDATIWSPHSHSHKIAEIENDDTVSQATIVETIANTNVNTGKEA